MHPRTQPLVCLPASTTHMQTCKERKEVSLLFKMDTYSFALNAYGNRIISMEINSDVGRQCKQEDVVPAACMCVYEYVNGFKRVCRGGNVLFTFPLLMFLRNCFLVYLETGRQKKRK